GWWNLFEPELHLGSDILVPDLAGWRVKRMPEFPDTAFATLAPDWVCEILSPSTACLDRAKKLDVYARERVPHAWLLDPIAQTLEILRLDGRHWVIEATHQAADRVRAVPFDAVEIDLAYLWGPAVSEAAGR
ncbi:MAG: Uma2 family endonuclease, partial [Vicinamibacteraceae bacterium]